MAAELNLLPCPFCGGAAHVETEFRHNRVIECSSCGVNVGAVYLERGIAMWNRRAAPSSSADELPPLPEPNHALDCGSLPFFTAEQMQEYARSAIAADRRARQGEGSVINYGSPTKINMAQSGVGDYGRGYCAGWNDCVDDFSRAAIQAAAPAEAPKLDADELTRLRRLMRALGMDGSVNGSDEYVRGLLFTVLGQAAGKLERAPAEDAREQQPGIPAERRIKALETLCNEHFNTILELRAELESCRATGTDRAQAGEDA